MATEYLGVKQVADRLGITPGGLLNLKLPEPDVLIGRTRGWLPETIDEWNDTKYTTGWRQPTPTWVLCFACQVFWMSF